MITTVVVGFRSCQATLRFDVAVDPAFRILAPSDVEGRELGEEVETRIGQMVVYPPSERAPVGS